MDSELLWIIGLAIVTAVGLYLKRRYGANPLSSIETMLRRQQSPKNKAETKKLKAEQKSALVDLKTTQESRRTKAAAKMWQDASESTDRPPPLEGPSKGPAGGAGS